MCISSISLISKKTTNVVLIVLDVSYVHSMKSFLLLVDVNEHA